MAASPGLVLGASATWIGPASGSWNNPANWSSGVVAQSFPIVSYDSIFIDGGNAQNSSVTASTDIFISNLTIDAGDSLAFGSGQNMYCSSSPLTVNGQL